MSKQLRATGATTTLKAAVERAKIIMTFEQHTSVAAAQPQPTDEFCQLQQQITELTAQVAALSTQQPRLRTPAFVDPRAKCCFLCNKVGHLQYSCPGSKILLYLWSARPWMENLPTGKRIGGDCLGQWSSSSVSPLWPQ